MRSVSCEWDKSVGVIEDKLNRALEFTQLAMLRSGWFEYMPRDETPRPLTPRASETRNLGAA